ncbi:MULTISPECIES: polysaccharide pyruvyl transferase family protein [unclassified Thioalkalivibrio]|uniref:polysaccharide pyruvyl transferase family protein n=1 Tax=unclassified Thioalkalivibrio TaxID=2621013 RepID=UPI0009D94142|nr:MULTISPECIES: polysaccharide pyruvyl transferase family protein [unclassified Thioalkalivibrio]
MVKVLHVASFIGNVGDNASHAGFYRVLGELLDAYSVDQVEIRQFYRNYRHGQRREFDEDFIATANTYDLVVYGGGGFLDYWVPNSLTGTTLDIDPSLVDKIRVPTLVTSMGCFPHKNVPMGNVRKVSRFLDALICNSKIAVALRNDGSLESVKRHIGEHYADELHEVLDSGFFYRPVGHRGLHLEKDYVAINVTADQIRLRSSFGDRVDCRQYYEELASVVTHIIYNLGLDIVLVPHIYADLSAITELFTRIDDFLIRSHISVAPCVQGEIGAEQIFSVYERSRAVIGSRLHANVCSMAMGKKVIGLAALDRVLCLHRSVKSSSAFPLRPGFSADVNKAISREQDPVVSREIARKKKQTVHFYESILGRL